MVTIIFDFDDTLFKTHKLKKNIFDKIESFGIPKELVKNTYDIVKTKFEHYTPNNHIKVINNTKCFFITKKQKAEIENIDFTFYKVEEIFNTLYKLSKNNKLILLTIGDEKFQRFKINNSGLASVFKEINIISEKKEDFIFKKNYKGNIIFINDKKNENNIIRKMFPDIKVIDFNINKGSLEELPLYNLF